VDGILYIHFLFRGIKAAGFLYGLISESKKKCWNPLP